MTLHNVWSCCDAVDSNNDEAGLIIGIFMSVVGMVLIVVGSVTGGKKKEAITQIEPVNLNTLQQLDTTNKIYCRYCGKQRPAIGNYCPLCGRSTSTHVNETKGMQQCIDCNSLLCQLWKEI